MRQLLLAAALLGSSLMVQAQITVKDANAERRNVPSFHSLHVSSAFEVILTQGNEEGLAVSASDKKDIGRIITEVKDGELNIRFDNKGFRWGNNLRLRAYVSAKNLQRLQVSGATKLTIEGKLTAQDLSIELSGASKMMGRLAVSGKLEVEISGASDANLSGSANATTIEANGASDFDGYDLQTATCEVEASGASSVYITAQKEISAELSGASKLRYKGEASMRNIRTSGASSVSRRS